jgi:replicative DNA helicase
MGCSMIHSLEAEQSVLSAVLIGAISPVDTGLSEHHFFVGDHQLIWRTCIDLDEKGVSCDMITVVDKLDDQADYIFELVESSRGSAGMVKDYAKIILEKYQRRMIWQAGMDLQMGAESDDLSELSDIANAATDIDVTRGDETPDHAEAMRSLFTVLDDRNMGRVKPGLSTGSADLDKMIKPLKAGDLVVIAGRPGMGKSIAMTDLMSVACEEGPVLCFSLEMPRLQLYERMAAAHCMIPYDRIQTGDMEQHQWQSLATGMHKIKDWQLEIDDRPALSPAQMRAKARKFKRKYGSIKALFVDYLQIMQTGKKSDGRTNDVGYLSGQLKALAKEFECPVIALSQLNRGVESRQDKRPVMSDLRESGAIEQDADLIVFLYREEYYSPTDGSVSGIAEWIIGKQRGGMTGIVTRAFQGQYQRFVDAYNGGQ